MKDPITTGGPQGPPVASQFDSQASLGQWKGCMIDQTGDHSVTPARVDLEPGWTLEQRSSRAVEEVRAAAAALEPQAGAWKLALRDVHSHIFGERTSVLDDALDTDLIDAYRHLYDEMLRLSTLLDPDISHPDQEVPG